MNPNPAQKDCYSLAEEARAALNRLTSLVREQQGWGLGLYFSSKLVELMGGEIGASSSFGEGSRFWFSIPARW